MSTTKQVFRGMFIISLLSLMIPCVLQAQSTGADTIWLGNPSFEDVPRAGGSTFPRPIRGWIDCGESFFPTETPPDIHPASAWQVTKSAQDGNTYLGIVVRDDETWESLSQSMSATMKAGECYEFSAWLCRSERYMSRRSERGDSLYPFTKPAVLRIYGGKTFCDQGELLAESTPVSSYEWAEYVFKFEPATDHKYFMIQAFYKTPVLAPYNGHLLVDHLSPIVRIPCDQEETLEEEDPVVVQPTNTKPTPTPNNSAKTKPPTKPTPSVTKAEVPQFLTELERAKLHKGKTIRIEKLYFDADSSNFQPTSFPVLDEIAKFMIQNPDVIIEVGGHTNTKPSNEFCDQLSTARAKSVMDYLLKNGVPNQQLQYKGYGKTKPLVPNDWYDRDAQAKNQRVEIKILKVG